MENEHKLEKERARLLRSARRVVIKIGTATVTGQEGNLCHDRVEPVVRSIAALMKEGRQVVLVSSGAVGLGRGWLGLHRSRLEDMVTKQACAAVGQSLLMDAYKNLFSKWGIKIAQVLLTEEDFTNWRRYSNLQHTIEKLLGFEVLPIVNENDTVSTAELEPVTPESRTPAFSDNDRLAALVMSGLEADALVLLTNVDGLLEQSRNARSKAARDGEVIPLVAEITPEIQSLAAGPSESGRGGMRTKLEASEIAMRCGGIAVIANGSTQTRWIAFLRAKDRDCFFARQAHAGKTSLDCLCSKCSRTRGSGRRRTPSNYSGKSEPAGIGNRARGKPVCIHGRGEHRGFRGT